MSDPIMFDIGDNYKEHQFHNEYDPACSTCYSENRLIKAKKMVVSNYPEGVNRFNPPWLD